MRTQLLLLIGSLLITLAAGACSDTGMLIRASTADDFNQPIDSLRFYVGTESVDDPLFWVDKGAVKNITLNQDIGEDPYRLLLKPNGDMGEIIVAALAFEGDRIVGFGRLESPVSFSDGVVLEWNLLISSARGGVFTNTTGCLYFPLDNGDYITISTGDDKDCDGSPADEDCNDANPDQSPDTPEDCFNEIDDDCNGLADAEDTIDGDMDGFANCGDNGGDCHDGKAAINPDAEDICDGIDNNCDWFCDDAFDVDKDGVSTCGSLISVNDNFSYCYAMGDSDCDDDDYTNFPGNTEVCDGRDNNCNDQCDDENLDELDTDSDGYTACGSLVGHCLGTDPGWEDCNDDDAFMHPGKHELCDGKDNDCDGQGDPQRVPCFANGAGGDDCHETTVACSDGVISGVCQPDGGIALDADWCDDYDDCQSYVDPFFCSIQKAGNFGQEERCTLKMQDATTPCPGPKVVQLKLSTNGSTGDVCDYTVVGGSSQQGYKVSFRHPGEPGVFVGDRINSCEVGLAVSLPGALWPGKADIAIYFVEDDGNTEEMHLHLDAVYDPSCEGPALSCATLEAGVPLPLPAPEPMM